MNEELKKRDFKFVSDRNVTREPLRGFGTTNEELKKKDFQFVSGRNAGTTDIILNDLV